MFEYKGAPLKRIFLSSGDPKSYFFPFIDARHMAHDKSFLVSTDAQSMYNQPNVDIFETKAYRVVFTSF